MRTGVPAAALLTAGIGLSPDPSATLRLLAADLAGSGESGVGVLFAVVAGGMVTWAAPRVCLGGHGWVRHLPADWPAHRRALLAALTAAELPVAIAWCALWLVAWRLGAEVELRGLLAMPVVLIGVSLTRMPARWSIVVGSAGVITVGLALFGGWPGLTLAVAVVLAVERLIVPPRGRARPAVLWRVSVPADLLPGLIAFRAIGRRLLNAYAPVLVPLGAAWLYVHNNPDVSHVGPLRLAAGSAVALVIAGLAVQLMTRRPPWRWARSLPWGAADRVRDDVLWLAMHAVPILVVFGVLLGVGPALHSALIVPLIAVRAAGALRTPHGKATFTRVLGEGVFMAAWLSITVWTAVPALSLVWPAWRQATARDRNLDVSRWSPQAHLTSGDPAS